MSPVKNIEELFLKIFKITILVIMGLALIAILYFLATAAYQFSQSPKEPAPAQKAPEKTIGLEDLKAYLIEQEKRKNSKDEVPKQQVGDKPSLLFLEDATTLFRCSESFARNVSAVVENTDQSQRVENLRVWVERSVSGSSLRGEPWLKSAVTFACMVLADPSIIALKKEGKLGAVFYPTLEFHRHMWDQIQAEKLRFEQAEEKRVSSERASEAARVALAKAAAMSYLIASGIAFALFMVLALYLLGAKIETDLRDINASIQARGQQGIG